MKTLRICTGWTTHDHTISDDAEADAAFKVLTDAMASYSRFDNDKSMTVSFSSGDGTACFRVESLVHVSMDAFSEKTASAVVEREVWNQRLKTKIAAAMAPAVS